jgi:hypothetical protein
LITFIKIYLIDKNLNLKPTNKTEMGRTKGTSTTTTTTYTNTTAAGGTKKLPGRLAKQQPRTAPSTAAIQATRSTVSTPTTSIRSEAVQLAESTGTLATTSSLTSAASVILKKKYISELVEKGRKGVFDKVVFTIGGEAVDYTPLYNWYDGVYLYEEKPQDQVEFFCKICKKSKKNLIGKPGNLKKHLESHSESKEWVKAFTLWQGTPSITNKLDSSTINMVKFFLNSNIAVRSFQDKYLRRELKLKLGKYALSKRVIPDVLKFMYKCVEERLQMCDHVHLITDIWTGASMSDFIALAAILTNNLLQKQFVILGMEQMEGRHTAENILVGVEKIANRFEFNKDKCDTITADEGSNICRLFVQEDFGRKSLFL